MKTIKRIRILFTIPNFKTAGSQFVVLSLFKEIDKQVFEPYICVESYPEAIPEDIPQDRCVVWKRTGNKRRDIMGFKRILKKHKIGIVHSWDYKSGYSEVSASIIAGIPYLYTKKNNSWSRRWLLKSVLASHIAYDHPEMKQRFFDSWYFKGKISFIPHGVDTKIFRPLPPVSHDSFNLVCIGNIGANKNQLFLLKTLSQLPENVVLHLYGKEDKKYKRELDRYIEKAGLRSRVFFYGFVANNEIPEVLRKMDLFVLPSINEGLPVSILEAMACGVPVLSSDSGGGSRYLLSPSQIFHLDHPDHLVAKIKSFLQITEAERNTIIQESIQKVRDNHTVEKEVAAYERLYRRLIDT